MGDRGDLGDLGEQLRRAAARTVAAVSAAVEEAAADGGGGAGEVHDGDVHVVAAVNVGGRSRVTVASATAAGAPPTTSPKAPNRG